MPKPIKVLLIEDNPGDERLAREALMDGGTTEFVMEHAADLAGGLMRLAEGGIDVVVSDLGLPDSEGLAAVARLKAHARGIPILVLTGTFDERNGVDALRVGAQDYLIKDELSSRSLTRAIRYAIERKRGEEAIAKANRDLAEANRKLSAAREELEKRVEARTAELGRANRDLETMLYVATHDLKEPLNAILSFSAMLTATDEKGKDLIARIRRGCERMRHLLDDMITLTRAQRIEVPEGYIPGNEIVDEALARVSERIRNTGAHIHVEKPLPRWRAHRTWAVEAVVNLISNALKFAAPGTPPDIEITGYAGAEGPGIIVRDRGPGIPDELRERIFQLFQRGVSRDVEGTGAGLAIVRQVAERHGGRVWMTPRPGGGSEFFVTFGSMEAETRPIDILVVDDDDDFVYILRESLAGYTRIRHIAVARDGVEALSALKEAPPDVVLLDINMPRKNGFEVLTDMRHDPDLRTIPVAMVTSSSRREDEIKARAEGAAAYLTKPFGVADLMNVVNSLVR